MHKVRKAAIDTNVLAYSLFEGSAVYDEAASMLDQLAKLIYLYVVHELVLSLKRMVIGLKNPKAVGSMCFMRRLLLSLHT